jgi:hypothetical protein
MGKWMLLLGIVLMVVAMIALVMGLSNSPQTIAISQALVCQPGEKYSEALGRSVYSGTESMGREFFAYCESDGSRRDVTPQAFAVKAGMFAVPFVLGLLLFVFGIFVMVWRGSRSLIGQVVTATTSGSGQPVSKIIVNGQPVDSMPPEIDQMLKGFFGDSTQPQNRANLTDRLRQLQEAYDARLISKDEYERVRQQILDSMDD